VEPWSAAILPPLEPPRRVEITYEEAVAISVEPGR